MKRILYITLLFYFLCTSFVSIEDVSLENFLIGKCWVRKNYPNPTYYKRLGFNPGTHGLRFINENEMIVYTSISFCGNASRTQFIGNWQILNDSVIAIKYLSHRESIVKEKYKVVKKRNGKAEFKLLFYQEYTKEFRPKPFLN